MEIQTAWTKDSIAAGFDVLHSEQFTRKGGRTQSPSGGGNAERTCSRLHAEELKRGVTKEMAEAAGHGKMPLAKVIRQKCLACAGSSHEVALCHITDCPCWPYRFGKNPFSTRKGKPGGNPEVLKRAREAKRSATAQVGETA